MFPIELLCGLVGLASGGAALSCIYVLVTTVIEVVVLGEEVTHNDAGEEVPRLGVGFATALVLLLGFSAAVLFDVLQHLVRLV